MHPALVRDNRNSMTAPCQIRPFLNSSRFVLGDIRQPLRNPHNIHSGRFYYRLYYYLMPEYSENINQRTCRDELNKLFEAVAGTKLELPVLLGAFYGLRRSEIVGLKWSAIDFEQNTITISHTVTSCNLDGKCVIVAKDTTKTKSSRRTLPLVPYFHEKLLAVKAQQERNQKLCGRSYNREFLEYICVDDIGDRFKPNYITSQFPKLLERNGFRKIRFHDLRHSCASLLLASGVPMKHIQEWLGHSDFSTTANIYAHLDYSSKLTSASAMESNFHLGV